MDVTEEDRLNIQPDDDSTVPQLPLEEITTSDRMNGMSPITADQLNLSDANNSVFGDAQSSSAEGNFVAHNNSNNGDPLLINQQDRNITRYRNGAVSNTSISTNDLIFQQKGREIEESHNQLDQNNIGFCDGTSSNVAPTEHDLMLHNMLHRKEEGAEEEEEEEPVDHSNTMYVHAVEDQRSSIHGQYLSDTSTPTNLNKLHYNMLHTQRIEEGEPADDSNATNVYVVEDQRSSTYYQHLLNASTPQDVSLNSMIRREGVFEEEEESYRPFLKSITIYDAMKVFSCFLIFFAGYWCRASFVTNANDPPKNSPAVERFKQAWTCGTQITNNNDEHHDLIVSYLRTDNDEETIQDTLPLDVFRGRAINWFVTGAGKNINLDDDNDCTSRDSLFSILYSLLVLRESIGISDPDWYTNVPVQNTADVCKWSRVHCSSNDSNNNDISEEEVLIEKLIFNNADLSTNSICFFFLAIIICVVVFFILVNFFILIVFIVIFLLLGGTIPPELMRLTNLISLELYTNQRLSGFIPTSIGKLTNLEYLFLQATGLSGSIPSEIGELISLRQFHFDNTPLLVGTMPESICKLTENGKGHLDSLRGTCGSRIFESCSCCKSCRQPIITMKQPIITHHVLQ